MKAILLFLFLANVRAVSDSDYVLDDALIRRVNSDPSLPWTAGRNKRFEGVTIREAKAMQGTVIPKRVKSVKKADVKATSSVPKSFDSRQQWPGCVHAVLDQGQCGSCWAFGATESLSDRFCIASNGKVNVTLSPESLVSCDWEGNDGCNGGIPQLAWEYMEYAGVATLECSPYSAGAGTSTPSCATTCSNGAAPTYYYAEKFSQHTYLDADEIQAAIMSSGPVEGTMSVYSDFMNYESGVYVAASNATYLGGHAIKMVGWGYDQPSRLDYWIVQNSWGTDWGLDGFFWIAFGQCGIDDDAVAGAPSL